MNIIKTLAIQLLRYNMDAILITDNVGLAYVTGMSNIEGAAFITRDEKAYCFTDSRYIEAAQKIVSPRGFEVSTVGGNNYFKHIGQMCRDVNIKILGFEDAYMTVQEYKRAQAAFDSELADASGILQELRTHKSSFEANSIKRAQKIADRKSVV